MSTAIKVSFGVLLALLLGLCLYAQDPSQHFISAKAGMVNYVEGKPLVFTSDNEAGSKVSPRDQLKSGDRLQTQENDRVEVLLNPGSYLRVAANSEIHILQTAFDDTHFRITRGVAILESAAFDKKVHSIKMSTPAGDVKILANGLYRFEVSPDRPVEVLVYSGKAKWLKDQHEVATLKSGKRYDLDTTGNGLQNAKLGKQSMDDLDTWSKRRAESLVAMNDRLSPSLLDYSYFDYGYRSHGMWIYNPFFQMFTFLPFSYGFLSPYGFAYNYYYPVYTYGGYARGAGGASGSSPTQSGTGKASGSRSGNSRSGNTSPAAHRPSVSTTSSPSPRVSTGRSDGGSLGGRGTGRQR